MRVVADTNTLVSGFGWHGAPAGVVDAITRVLRYPKLASVFPDPDRIVGLVRAVADTVQPTSRLAIVADEPDNRVLEAATDGQADAIVTGDRELLNLRTFRDISVLTAADLLSSLR